MAGFYFIHIIPGNSDPKSSGASLRTGTVKRLFLCSALPSGIHIKMVLVHPSAHYSDTSPNTLNNFKLAENFNLK